MLGGRCWSRLLLRENFFFLWLFVLVFGMGWVGIGGVGYIPFNFQVSFYRIYFTSILGW